MLDSRSHTLSTRFEQAWPTLVVAFGVIAVIAWTAALAWLLVEVVDFIV